VIVKGRPRKDGHALAAYFMESEDGARRIFGTDPMGDTVTAMTEWDEIGRATRGEKPLYHLQLCPDAKYPVTDEQFKRMAEIVIEEVGAKGHDYELYYHPGVKDNGEPDKPHAHLAICRTNRDTMKMLDLSYNYVAHERASKRIALEFGMEIVPGKHAKRDRRKQPEFPRAKANEAEHQQAARTGITVAERKQQVTALRQQADGAQAFKNALEDAGYILAKGDKRGLVIVDQQGEVYSLSRQVTDLKAKEFKAFMQPIDPATLPGVEEAKATQAARQTVSKQDAAAEAEKKGAEASKFMQPESTSKPPEAKPATPDAELEALKKAIADREAAEVQKWAAFHAQERKQLEFELNKEKRNALAVRNADDLKAMQALKEQIRERTRGVKGLVQAIENRWNPKLGAERAQARQREILNLARRQAKERKDYAVLLEQVKQEQLDNLKERQNLQLRDAATKRAEERERHVRDFHEARRLREQLRAEELKKDLKKSDILKDGPPPPKLGK
jgi:MobA/VirD2-like, nuclease domain